MVEILNTSFTAERLSAEGLACRRGGRFVFQDLHFDIGPSEYIHLAGSNGSGKSTLLRVIAGLIPAVEGQIFYGQQSVRGTALSDSATLLYAGHEHGLKPAWTLRENYQCYVKILSGQPLRESRFERMLDSLGLGVLADERVGYFSSGQLHRASLLRFLLLDRPLWLMDEPTVGLDAENRRRLETVMADHLERGGMIIAASHDPINIPGQTLRMTDFAPQHITGSQDITGPQDITGEDWL